MVLSALCQAGGLFLSGHRSGDSRGSEGQGTGEEVSVQEVVAGVTKPSVRVKVAWLVASESWIVA